MKDCLKMTYWRSYIKSCLEVGQLKRLCIDFSIIFSCFHVIHYKTNLCHYLPISPLLTV